MEQRQRDERLGEPIPEPEAVHTRPSTPQDESDDEREATELYTVRGRETGHQQLAAVRNPTNLHWYEPIKKLWIHHIRLSVPHVDCRDHLGG